MIYTLLAAGVLLAGVAGLLVACGMAKCMDSEAAKMKDEAEQDCATAPCCG